ncbi:MAG TPA: FAD-dependent oxidoreductase [Roseiarcus sp.]|nr:FAD-dependent oxidoreductase [Roseiarcus sp.]
MRAAVVGAGVFGLAAATELAERGFAVTLYERNPGLGGNASWLAGGMLAPFCEGESASPDVVERGQRAVEWWARHAPVTRNGTLVLAPPRDAPDLDRFAQRTQGWQRLDEAAIGSLEPDLAERFRQGLWFAGEGHVDAREAMNALCQRLIAKGAELRFGQPFPGAPHNGVIVDCRGYTARDALPQLRGVRGEMLLVRTSEVRLSRPVRLLHPRIPLYVVPRANGLFMIGATMIESAETGGVTVRSAIELLSAAFALHPAFGEAEIVEMSAGVRPAYPDNEPRLVERDGRLCLNGAYRHGFLLAPDLAMQAAERAAAGAPA